MKISELLKELQEILTEDQDMEVFEGGGSEIVGCCIEPGDDGVPYLVLETS